MICRYNFIAEGSNQVCRYLIRHAVDGFRSAYFVHAARSQNQRQLEIRVGTPHVLVGQNVGLGPCYHGIAGWTSAPVLAALSLLAVNRLYASQFRHLKCTNVCFISPCGSLISSALSLIIQTSF